MVLGRRSFLRSLATAVVGVGIAPKIFLAQTEIILPEPITVHVSPFMPPGRIDYMSIAAWGKIKWGEPPYWFTAEDKEFLKNMKEPHGY